LSSKVIQKTAHLFLQVTERDLDR